MMVLLVSAYNIIYNNVQRDLGLSGGLAGGSIVTLPRN